MQGALSQLRTWELNRKQDDIRGWPLRDAEGRMLGNVGELIVDTDTEHVTQIVLSDGRRYSAHEIVLGNGVLRLGGNGSAKTDTIRSAAAPAKSVAASAAGAVAQAAASAAGAVAEAAKGIKEKVERQAAPRAVPSDPGDLVIPLVDEEVDIGKRRVEAGGMRVTTHTIEKPFDRDIKLYEEKVEVERRRVDRPLSAAEADETLREASIEMHAKAERAVVQKHAHVVEEVVLRKQALDRVERLEGSVRHTEAEVENLSNGHASRTQKRS